MTWRSWKIMTERNTTSIADLEQDIEHRFAGLRRLLEVTDRINPGVLLDEAFRQIDDACRQLIPYDRIEFALLDDRGTKLESRWENPPPEEPVESPRDSEDAGQGPLREVLDSGEPRIIEDLHAPTASARAPAALCLAMAAGMRCTLICPLSASGKAVGFLFLSSRRAGAFEAQHVEILRRITGMLSSAIAKGKLYEMVIRAQLESERLLRNVLPEPIVKRLKAGEQVIADGIPEATVVFVDIVNFVHLSSSMSPSAVIIVLNRIFSAFDALCEQYGVEKIKTIGDAYMLATGVPNPIKDHIVVAARIALDMQELARRLGTREEQSLNFRIGIHTGPVVAGVIGTRKFSYDIWGDTVNLASRMEANGVPGRIHVTRAVYDVLKNDFEFEARGFIPVKGLGDVETFFLNGPKQGNAYRSVVWSMLDSGNTAAGPGRRRSEDR